MADEETNGELDLETARRRTNTQLDLIEAAVGSENFGWYTPGSGSGNSGERADFSYLFKRGHVLVRTDDLDRVRAVLTGSEPVQEYTGIMLLQLGADEPDVPEALRRLDRETVPGLATPDHIFHVTPAKCCPATEPEPTDAQPWPPESEAGENVRDVSVRIVDTGWCASAALPHSWLNGANGDPEYIDYNHIHPYAGHGTFIAGILRCVSPNTADVFVEGFAPNGLPPTKPGQQGGASFESDIFTQVEQALTHQPDIISLSAGTTSRHNLHLLAFEVLWETQVEPLGKTILVAAAGNDGTNKQFYPAALPWVYAVGSLDHDGSRSSFSNYGSWVDGYAVGRDLVNAFPDGDYTCTEPPNEGDLREFRNGMARWSGTSFSTPTVSGMIAARMHATGETSRQAADVLFDRAEAAKGSTGGLPVLTPGPQNNQ